MEIIFVVKKIKKNNAAEADGYQFLIVSECMTLFL